jgi:hypothetical protein
MEHSMTRVGRVAETRVLQYRKERDKGVRNRKAWFAHKNADVPLRGKRKKLDARIGSHMLKLPSNTGATHARNSNRLAANPL